MSDSRGYSSARTGDIDETRRALELGGDHARSMPEPIELGPTGLYSIGFSNGVDGGSALLLCAIGDCASGSRTTACIYIVCTGDTYERSKKHALHCVVAWSGPLAGSTGSTGMGLVPVDY